MDVKIAMGPQHDGLIVHANEVGCGDAKKSNTQQGRLHPRIRGLVVFTALLLVVDSVTAWRSGSSSSSGYSVFGDNLNRDWLDSSSVMLMVNGCVWSQASNTDDGDCIGRSSQDGKAYWYQMANCRRPQVAFSLYASDSSSSTTCTSTYFKESFVTTGGPYQFLNLFKNDRKLGGGGAGGDNQKNDNRKLGGGGGGDNHNNNKNKNNDGYSYCQSGNNGYYGLACGSDGSFVLAGFNDQYCLSPTGEVVDSLDSFNSDLSAYKDCVAIGQKQGQNGYSLAYYLTKYAESCSNLDSSICQDGSAMSSRRSSASSKSDFLQSFELPSKASWSTKLKFVSGGLLLLGAFVLFTGILFTNRRRRRALLQRKFRQTKARDERSKKSKSRSKSRTRDGEGTSRKSSRSKTRSKSRTRETPKEEESGVMA